MDRLITPIAFAAVVATVFATLVHPALGILVVAAALLPLYAGPAFRILCDPIAAFGLLFPLLYLANMTIGLSFVRYAQLLVFGLVVWQIVRLFLDDWTLKRLPLRYATWVVLFVAWVFFAAAMSQNAERSFAAAGSYLFVLVGFVVLNHWLDSEAKLLRFFDALILGTFFYAFAVTGLMLNEMGGGLSTMMLVKGEILGVNTNGIPIPVMFCLPIVATRLVADSHHRSRYVLILIVFLLVVYLSMSRSAWLGTAAGGSACLLVHEISAGRVRRLLRIGVAFGGVALVLVAWKWQELSLLAGLDRGTTGRIYLWNAALQMISDHPITGIGPGMWPVMDAVYAVFDGPIDLTHYANHAHNTFLTHAAEMGIPAGFGALAFVGLLFRDSLRGAFDRRMPLSDPMRIHLIGCVGVVILITVRGFFESTLVLWPGIPSSSAWLIFIAVSMCRLSDRGANPITVPESGAV